MNCKKCGAVLPNGAMICNNCGQLVDLTSGQNNYVSPVDNKPKESIFKKLTSFIKTHKTMCAFVIIGVLALSIVIVLTKEERTDKLLNIEKSNNIKFTFNDEKYYIGQTAKELKQKGLMYDSVEGEYIPSDSITVFPFYLNDKPVFLGALYCASEEKCSYDEAVLIKANFYDNSGVVLNDLIRRGSSYDDIKEKYGKEDGKFYQDEAMLVWSLGEKGKIGEPYYILKFNSYNNVEEIRIGIWWYEEEYEYTIKNKEVSNEE